MMTMVTCAKQWQSAHIDVAHQVWVVHTSRWVFSNLVMNDEIIAWVIQAMKPLPEKRRTGMWCTWCHVHVCIGCHKMTQAIPWK